MTLSFLFCFVSFLALLSLLRTDRVSLGLPIAYLFSLFLIHAPGAFADLIGPELFSFSDLTEIGMRFVAIGSICFVGGVWLARSSAARPPISAPINRDQFGVFCLVGGWIVEYALKPLHGIPTVGAAVDKGAGLWMLGVLLALRAACHRGDLKRIVIWLSTLMVYPAVVLLLGGFLSYGTQAIIIVLAVLTISTQRYWLVAAGVAATVFFGLSVFVVYFQHRDEIRYEIWGGAPLQTRIETVVDAAREFQWFDPTNAKHLIALDGRLNQNYFVGLAAQRTQQGEVHYLYGRSVLEGLLALVPRILWPQKPLFAGSPGIVSEMTGLQLSPTTSFGIGNVMEFQVNFGTPGVIVGFLMLGWAIGKLDLLAASAEMRGDLAEVMVYFLPAVALIQPNGSLIELFGGSAAALIAALGWKQAWHHRLKRKAKRQRLAAVIPAHRLENPSYGNKSVA